MYDRIYEREKFTAWMIIWLNGCLIDIMNDWLMYVMIY